MNNPTSIKFKNYRACKPLRDAVFFSMVLQVPLLTLASLVTDGGGIYQILFFAFVAFNSYLLSTLLFRPKSPTLWDLQIIRAGFLPTIVAAFYLSNWVWDLRGF